MIKNQQRQNKFIWIDFFLEDRYIHPLPPFNTNAKSTKSTQTITLNKIHNMNYNICNLENIYNK